MYLQLSDWRADLRRPWNTACGTVRFPMHLPIWHSRRLSSHVMETCHVELTDCDTGLCADFSGKMDGRSERIRTSDPLLPKQVRYQAALHSAMAQRAEPVARAGLITARRPLGKPSACLANIGGRRGSDTSGG